MKNAVSLTLAATALALGLAASAAPVAAAPATYAGHHQIMSVDDGTGYWGHQTATGGPSGGLPNTQ